MRSSWALMGLLALGVAMPARAGIHIVSDDANVDRSAGVARFHVRFDSAPDLWTVDEFGRVADSFQYEIDGNWNAPLGLPPQGLDSVVRGDEIHVADALRIRDARFGITPDPDPDAGGWGAVKATVPFSLKGSELRFEAPLAAIGDDDGYFAYRLFTTEYGLTSSEVERRLLPPGEPGPQPATIPLPPAIWSAASAAGFLLAARVARRIARRN
jgi:hypothetical protein